MNATVFTSVLTSWWLLRPMPSFHAPFWPTSLSSSSQSWWLFRQCQVKRAKRKCLQIFILLLLSCLGHFDAHPLLFVSHILLSLCSPCTWLESWLLLKRHKVQRYPQVLVGWSMLHTAASPAHLACVCRLERRPLSQTEFSGAGWKFLSFRQTKRGKITLESFWVSPQALLCVLTYQELNFCGFSDVDYRTSWNCWSVTLSWLCAYRPILYSSGL